MDITQPQTLVTLACLAVSVIGATGATRTGTTPRFFAWLAVCALPAGPVITHLGLAGIALWALAAAAGAGITLQPYGIEPGVGHVTGLVIMAGFDNTVNRSNTRSAEAAADCSTFMMLAVCAIGIVNWREYWMKACTSPSEMRPLATMMPPTTATAT